jgi:BMFP domain-containing protein YqiC
MKLTGENRQLGEKPVPVPLCPPQISYGLTWDRTRASVVRGRRLTAWAMARPYLTLVTRQKIHKLTYLTLVTRQKIHILTYLTLVTRQKIHILTYLTLVTRQKIDILTYLTLVTRQKIHILTYLTLVTRQKIHILHTFCAEELWNGDDAKLCGLYTRDLTHTESVFK